MAGGIFTTRTRWYFNRPEVMRRLGSWRHAILSRAGAYARGVFRNKLGRPQRKQTKERTVNVNVMVRNSKTGNLYPYAATLFVPRVGTIVEKATGKPAPREAALEALLIVAGRVKGQGKGRPPRMGPTKNMRKYNDFGLDPQTESVVVGTIPFKSGAAIVAASVPHLLDQMEPGAVGGFIENALLPGGSVFAVYDQHPYVESSLVPTVRKIQTLIRRKPVGV